MYGPNVRDKRFIINYVSPLKFGNVVIPPSKWPIDNLAPLKSKVKKSQIQMNLSDSNFITFS